MRKQQHVALSSHVDLFSRRRLLGRFAGVGGVAGLTALLPGCGGGGEDAASAYPERTQGLMQDAIEALPKLQTFFSGLANPWGMAFLPDRSMLVTERMGRLRHVSANGKRSVNVTGFPAARLQNSGHGGLLDVALEAAGGDIWVYLSYAERGLGSQSNLAGLAVARARLVNDDLRNFAVIFRALPKYPAILSRYHYGSRLVLASANKLLISIGEGRIDELRGQAQSLRSHLGKIVRINRNGSVPMDNPFVDRDGARPEIWTLGHRNPQGLVLHPGTGELWSSEHGPLGGDELNVILRGRNYGWPKISYGCEYGAPPDTCTVVGGHTAAPGLEQPVTHWGRARIAPSGMDFCDGRMFPEWQHHLILACLGGKELWRVVTNGRDVVSRTRMYASDGVRFRDVKQSPDGSLLVLTDRNNGQILRMAR